MPLDRDYRITHTPIRKNIKPANAAKLVKRSKWERGEAYYKLE